jgi:sigma-E factor negative regulatory protein RseB
MIRQLPAYLLASFITFAFADQPAENDAWATLQKASQAAHTQNYQGVFTYQSGSKSKSVQITHTNQLHEEYARILVLDGSPREILSHGNDAIIYHSQDEKVIIEKRRRQNTFPGLLPQDIDTLKAAYQARTGGLERIGGRNGLIVFLDPRDQYRYGYKFWTDQEYGLLLRSLMTNERNEVLEQITFNQLTFPDITNMDWFHPNINHDKKYWVKSVEPSNRVWHETDWIMTKLPAGFHKIDQSSHMMPGKSVQISHVIYSDGLAAVSLFVEPLNQGEHPKTGHWAMGATHIHATIVNGHQIMVVGEVPEATTVQIANAIRFK